MEPTLPPYWKLLMHVVVTSSPALCQVGDRRGLDRLVARCALEHGAMNTVHHSTYPVFQLSRKLSVRAVVVLVRETNAIRFAVR